MKKTSRASHVATIRRRHGDRVYKTHLLRRTYRESGKVKHETLANLSHLPDRTIEVIRSSLRGEELVATTDFVTPVRTLPHGHVAAVVGTLRNCGLESALASRPSRERSLVVAMIAARLISPGSKLATSRELHFETNSSTLGEFLGVESVSESELYAALDWLLSRQNRIEAKLAKKHLSEGSLVLYDVSGSYYTGSHCPIAKFGYSRDKRSDLPQITYGLLCDRRGCPVGVEVFEGNVGDPSTLKVQIEKVRQRFGIQQVVFVSDRGLITQARIREELAPIEGLEWITALRAPAIKKLASEGNIQLTLFDQRDLAELTSEDFPGERLVACRNPLLADERARKREALLTATEKKLEKIAEATRREKRRLRGAGKIGVRVGKVVARSKVTKHFLIEITDEGFSYRRNEEKIAAEAALDGIYILRTSLSADEMPAEETVRTYKSLSKVERAFRCLKTTDLHIRPIYHRLEDRVRAHVFLCVLAYYVEWHMRRALAPILFEDHDHAAAEQLRESIVAPKTISCGASKGGEETHRRRLSGAQLLDPNARHGDAHARALSSRISRR